MKFKQALLEAFPGHTIEGDDTQLTVYDCEGHPTVYIGTGTELGIVHLSPALSTGKNKSYMKKVIKTVGDAAYKEGMDVLLLQSGSAVGSTGEHSDAILGWLKTVSCFFRHLHSKALSTWFDVRPDIKRKAVDLLYKGSLYHSITSSKEARNLYIFFEQEAFALRKAEEDVAGSGNNSFPLFGDNHCVQAELSAMGDKTGYSVMIYPTSKVNRFQLRITCRAETLAAAVTEAKEAIQAFKEKNKLRYELSTGGVSID